MAEGKGFQFSISKASLFRFFLLVSLPINFWAMIGWFTNFEPVYIENGLSDAIGMGGYMMAFALVESIIIFLLAAIPVILLPKKWGDDRRLVHVSNYYFAFAILVMLQQFRKLVEFPTTGPIWRSINFLNSISASNLIILLPIGLILLTLLQIMIHRSDKALRISLAIYDRLVMLSGLYLFFNVAGLAIVIFRNLF